MAGFHFGDDGPEEVICARGGSASSSVNTFQCIANMLPDDSHPGAKQKRPMGLNRWIILTILTIYTITSSCVYFGWPSVAALLYAKGAYLSVCQDAQGYIKNDLRMQGKPYACDGQDTKVNSLFTTTFAAHMLVGAISGFVMEKLGPRMTGLIGQIFNIVAWILLSLHNPGFDNYLVGFIVLGGACGMIFLPSMTFVNLFPGHSGSIITILGSAASGSFAIPLIMLSIVNANPNISPSKVMLWYGFCACGVCAIIVAFMFPYQALVGPDAWDALEKQRSLKAREHSQSSQKTTAKSVKSGNGVIIDMMDVQAKSISTDDMLDTPEVHKLSTCPSLDTSRQTQGTQELTTSVSARNITAGYDADFFYANTDCRQMVRWPTLKEQLFSLPYACILLYSVAVNAVVLFVMTASGRMWSQQQLYILGILLPLQFIPCIGLGRLMDVGSPETVMILVNACGSLAMLFACGSTVSSAYGSMLLFSAYESVQTSQMFCYISKTFNSKHNEKLIGMASMVTGIVGLGIIPLYDIITVQYFHSPKPVCAFFAVLLLCMFFPLGFMVKWRKAHGNRFDPVPF